MKERGPAMSVRIKNNARQALSLSTIVQHDSTFLRAKSNLVNFLLKVSTVMEFKARHQTFIKNVTRIGEHIRLRPKIFNLKMAYLYDFFEREL